MFAVQHPRDKQPFRTKNLSSWNVVIVDLALGSDTIFAIATGLPIYKQDATVESEYYFETPVTAACLAQRGFAPRQRSRTQTQLPRVLIARTLHLLLLRTTRMV
jgi:hypothetical protein